MFPSNFSWPDIYEEEVTKEVKPLTLLVCPTCDHEAVVDSKSLEVLCGQCFKQGKHVDMFALGLD